MSRINTNILRVPGVSGQIDERPMGSFMAPMEAAGEALSQLGDIASSIAVKEQQVQDQILASELSTELQESAARAASLAKEAKSVEEIATIQNAFDADFKSIQERAGGIRGREKHSLFANQISLEGGKTALSLGAIKAKAVEVKGRNLLEADINRMMESAYASGNPEMVAWAVSEAERKVDEAFGTLFSKDWDNRDSIVQSMVNGTQHANFKRLVDEGNVTDAQIRNAKFLTAQQKAALQAEKDSASKVNASKSTRDWERAQREFIEDLDRKSILVNRSGDPFSSLDSVKKEIESFWPNDPDKAQTHWYGFVAKAAAQHSAQRIAVANDPESPDPESLNKSIERLTEMAGQQEGKDENLRLIYESEADRLLGVQEQIVASEDAKAVQQFEENLSSIVENIDNYIRRTGRMAEKNGRKLENLFEDADHFEDELLKASGMKGTSPNDAWRKDGIRENDYWKIVERIQLAKSEFVKLQNRGGLNGLGSQAINAPSTKNTQAYSTAVFTANGQKDFMGWESHLQTGEGLEGAADLVKAMQTTIAPTEIQHWALNHSDPAKAADMLMSQHGPKVLHWDLESLNPLEEKMAIGYTKYMEMVRANPEGDRAEYAKNSFGLVRETPDDQLEILLENIADDDVENVMETMNQWFYSKADFSDGELPTFPTGMNEGAFNLLTQQGLTPKQAASEVHHGFQKDFTGWATIIADREGYLGSFESKDLKQVPAKARVAVVNKAMGVFTSTVGYSYVFPSSPGELDRGAYSAEAALNFRGDGTSMAESGLMFSRFERGKRLPSSKPNSMAVLIYDAIRGMPEFKGALGNDSEWTKTIGQRHPEGAKYLKQVMSEVKDLTGAMVGEGTAGDWALKHGLFDGGLDAVARITMAKKTSGASLPSSSNFPSGAEIDKLAFGEMLQSGIITIGRGRALTEDELSLENGKRSGAGVAGVHAPHLDYSWALRVNVHDAKGNIIAYNDVIPSVKYASYDKHVMDKVAMTVRSEIRPEGQPGWWSRFFDDLDAVKAGKLPPKRVAPTETDTSLRPMPEKAPAPGQLYQKEVG